MKANLSSYPKSIILGETTTATTAYSPKPSLQQIEKYHVPLEAAGVGIFPAVAVNVKSTATDTLIPAGSFPQHWTLQLNPDSSVVLTDKEEGVGIPHAETIAEDFRISNHIFNVGSSSFKGYADSGAAFSILSSKDASAINITDRKVDEKNQGYLVPLSLGPYTIQIVVHVLPSTSVFAISTNDWLKHGYTIRLHEYSTELLGPS